RNVAGGERLSFQTCAGKRFCLAQHCSSIDLTGDDDRRAPCSRRSVARQPAALWRQPKRHGTLLPIPPLCEETRHAPHPRPRLPCLRWPDPSRAAHSRHPGAVRACPGAFRRGGARFPRGSTAPVGRFFVTGLHDTLPFAIISGTFILSCLAPSSCSLAESKH